MDTGLTLSSLTETLRSRKPRSLEVCTLLDKKRTLPQDVVHAQVHGLPDTR